MTKQDEARREEAIAAGTERGKEWLRFGQSVLTAFTNSEPIRVTAERLGCSPKTVRIMRAWMQLEHYRTAGETYGRVQTRAAVDKMFQRIARAEAA